MSKNKGKPKQHTHDGKGGKGQSVENKNSSKQHSPVDFNKPVTLVFNATDTLFFKESRPMESMGELQSVFPPPIRTLAGAVRSLIGQSMDVDWHEYEQACKHDKEHPLREIIGDSDNLGRLKFKGAWLARTYKDEKDKEHHERLYPALLHLMQKEGEEQLFALTLAKETTWCDLGRNVRLAKLPQPKANEKQDKYAGAKPLENTWLSASALLKVLQGEAHKISFEKPSKQNSTLKQEVFAAKDLFVRESRLGIARDNASRTVEQGLLYQTQHIRPQSGLQIEVDVMGLPESTPEQAMLRLGGEGRSASIQATPKTATLPSGKAGKEGIALYLLTPLPISWTVGAGENWQPLPDFKQVKDSNPTIWSGNLNGIDLELHGAVTGKALREGGWDMANHQPRAVTSFIPAGSVFFCKVVKGDTNTAITALHNQHIGTQTEYGYGHIAVGVWNDDETQG